MRLPQTFEGVCLEDPLGRISRRSIPFNNPVPRLTWGPFLLGSPDHLLNLTTHFESHAPLLKTLSLTVASTRNLVLQDSIFGGNLSSLHELYLNGVITTLAWEDMSNLRTFDFSYVPSDKISITQLLHFFEHAPLLRKIRLYEALPDFSDVPLGRMVPLPNLNSLVIRAHQAHTIVTNHLSIPTGATII